MKIFGIVNITEDSFSDGGRFLSPDAAIAHARSLTQDGADVIDLGAAASNPDAKPVPPDVEIARLAPVVAALKAEGISISIDSFSPEVQRWALAQEVDYLNDIHGFADSSLYPALADAKAGLIVMHAIQAQGSGTLELAERKEIFDCCLAFFQTRIAAFCGAGIARERLILDPGMGFFLGEKPENSLTMLPRLGELKQAFGFPLLVSVSRKSFLRNITGRTPMAAGAATLAAELFALLKGADYIRTHDAGAVQDAVKVWRALDPAAFVG